MNETGLNVEYPHNICVISHNKRNGIELGRYCDYIFLPLTIC